MTRIVAAGITTLDFIYSVDVMPSEALKYRSKALTTSGGGLAGNAATACARLGCDVRLIARLGDDPVAQSILAEFHDEGVDTSGIRLFAGHRSPVSAVMVDPAGERMVVSYSDDTIPAGTDWFPADLGQWMDAAHTDTRWIEAALAVLAEARKAGKPSVLDADRKPTRPEVIGLASHVGFSAQALREFTGIHDLPVALAQAAAAAVNILIVTDGPRGCWYMEGGRVHHVPAFAVNAVDTLGAGDTWHGALAVALAEAQPLGRAIRFASAAAALKCTEFGGRKGMPTRSALDHFLKGS
ncbi:sugar kinase [Phreatobacter aquaticus]|uniref:Sugar kinase n=1 Tax=Phreatobacter aquaticus TaxID=2570229 RepID=A0A4D7QIT3_9HYPH|nr:PfkB family carbohydrate kinase [Phreatobacter aquaticus]QCK87378.1 sugar kinase [Phreatobacter aquaticus]